MNKEKILLVLGTAVLAGGLIWLGFLLNKPGTIINQVGNKLGAVSNIRDVGPEFGMNGLQTIVQAGSFKDATTTIVSIQNPFPATSTVSFVGLFNTGVATSTYNINCGNSTRASAPRVTSNPDALYLQTVNIATSSIFSQELRTPTTTPTYIAPSGYFQCVAHGISTNDSLGGHMGWDSAFTGEDNTFEGKFWVEFKGLIQ